MKAEYDIRKIAAFLITITLLLLGLFWLKPVLVPLSFGALIAFLAFPPISFLDRKGVHPILSIVIVYLLAIVVLAGINLFFATQLNALANKIQSNDVNINTVFNQVFAWAESNFGIDKTDIKSTAVDNIDQILTQPLSLLGNGIMQVGFAMVSLVLSIIFSILLLYNRKAFKGFIISQFSTDHKSIAHKFIADIQGVTKSYLYGMLLVMLVIGTVNSLAFWAIGVPQPFLWGYMASLISIIPYIGTFIGALMPFTYSLLFLGTLWQPLAIVGAFIVIQQFEDNFLRPRIIGSKVDLNQLFALLAMIFGGFIWGVGGLIIALPAVAILRVVFTYMERTQALALLMSTQLHDKAGVFEKDYADAKHNLMQPLEEDE